MPAEEPITLTTVWGDWLLAAAGDRSRPEWSHETRLLLDLVQPGMTVVDLGAGFGHCTALFAHACGPQGRVYALEPEAANFDLLRRNVVANGYANVAPLRLAVGAHSGHATLVVSGTHHGRHSLVPANVLNPIAVEQVEVLTLNELLQCLPHRTVDLLKVDVEGAEWSVVQGGRGVLSDTVARVWLEFWPQGLRRARVEPAELLDALQALGFRLTAVDLLNGTVQAEVAPRRIAEYCDGLEATLGPDGQGNPLPLVYVLCEKADLPAAELTMP